MHHSHNPRALILGLLSCCPFSECDRDCPLREVRLSHVSEKKKLAFDDFTDSQVERIISYHEYCAVRRDNPSGDGNGKHPVSPSISATRNRPR
jgi:hypothetical protein